MDNIYVIASAWIRFERCYGTLDQLKLCQEKCKERLEEQEPEHPAASIPNENSANNLSLGDRNKGIKRKHFDRGRGRGGGGGASSAGVNRFSAKNRNDDNGGVSVKSSNNEWSKKIVNNTKKSKVDQKRNDSPPPNKRPRLENVAEIHDTQMIDTSKDNVTIFLSNLDYK